jgi:hypothetical protein
MKVTMMLADSAQAVEGKLYILGGGWSVTGPDPSPFAIAIKIEVPWDQANAQHQIRLALIDSDGREVMSETPEGPQPIGLEAGFEVGRPPGVKPGTPVDVPFALNFAPIQLEPGQRYVWQLEIDGESSDDWRVAFNTRQAASEANGDAV